MINRTMQTKPTTQKSAYSKSLIEKQAATPTLLSASYKMPSGYLLKEP